MYFDAKLILRGVIGCIDSPRSGLVSTVEVFGYGARELLA